MDLFVIGLGVLIVLIVIATIKNFNSVRSCPSDEDLKTVLLGKLDVKDPMSIRITQHLGICERCRNKVDQLV